MNTNSNTKSVVNKKKFLESLEEKNKKNTYNTNLINLQSSIYLDANKYISTGLDYQQKQNFESSKINMEKGVDLIKNILNSDSLQLNTDKVFIPKELVK